MKRKTILIIGMEGIGLILLYLLIKLECFKLIPTCWIYQNTGILCPACGGTRCLIFMLQGNWIKAFFSHTIFFMGILYLLLWNFLVIINRDRDKKIASWLYPKWWFAIIFAILLLLYTITRNLL